MQTKTMTAASGRTARASLLAAGIAITAGSAAPALAQEASPAVTATSDTGDVTDIIVSARRRAERLLDVPVAASALNAESLARYSTADLSTVANQVSQVNIDRVGFGNGAVINIRGVGSSSVDAAIEQEVTVNIDGVPISRGRVVTQALFDTQSVEVLKGPQALFFGKNSPAGVISVASTDPDGTLGGYAKVGYEFTANEYYGEGAISLPIASGLSVRIAGRFSDMTGGFIKNVSGPITDPALLPIRLVQAGITLPGAPQRNYPGTRDKVGRITLKYDDGGPFDANFKFLVSNHKDDGYSMATVILSCGVGQTRPQSLDIPSGRFLSDPYGSCGGPSKRASTGTIPAAIAAAYPSSNGGVPFVDTTSYLSSLTLNYALTDTIKLSSVTGYYKYAESGWGNFDYTTFAIASGKNDDKQRSWSQELRLASSFDTPFNFTIGAFYGNDKRSFIQEGTIGYLGVDPATGRTSSTAAASFYTGKTYSLFGELNWKITPDIELDGGARYTRERKSGDLGNTYIHTTLAAGFLRPDQRLVGAFTQSNVSPQVTLSYHPDKDVLIYAAYKTGFKSGGYSSPTRYARIATIDNQRFDQEKVRGGEVGLKFSTLGRRLTGDLTAYHYVYKGLQLTAYDGSTSSYFTQNAGSAKIEGVEFNTNLRATREFSLRTAIGYNDGRYDKFLGSQCFTGQTAAEGCIGAVQNLSGKRLSRAPRLSLLGGATYDLPLTTDWTLGATGDVRYSSGYYVSTNNSPFSWQEGFTTVNASLRLYSDNYELALIGRNLTDEIYGVVGTDKPLGPRGQVSGYIGRPREVLLQATAKF